MEIAPQPIRIGHIHIMFYVDRHDHRRQVVPIPRKPPKPRSQPDIYTPQTPTWPPYFPLNHFAGSYSPWHLADPIVWGPVSPYTPPSPFPWSPSSYASPYTPFSPLLVPPVSTPAWESGTYPPVPQGTPVLIRVHPHLIYNQYNPVVPILQWDIIHPASFATVFDDNKGSSVPVDLNEQAFSPDVPKVYIVSDHPVLDPWMEIWGPIYIERPSVKLGDVLAAIHDYFQEPLTKEDVDRVKKTSSENFGNLTVTAHQRARDSTELQVVCLASGFKRADVMGTHRKYLGLRPVVYPDKSWKLFLGLTPLLPFA